MVRLLIVAEFVHHDTEHLLHVIESRAFPELDGDFFGTF
jgi:hypothetical protein